MKTVLITGATSGIGLEVARLLARQGYHVLGIGRNEARCRQAEASILTENPEARVTYFTADLMHRREVVRIASIIRNLLDAQYNGELHALINNAGCVRSRYMTTEDGYEQQFALNHLAGFLLTHTLLPALKKAHGRVIMTGSNSHKGIRVRWQDPMLRRWYNPLIAYKQSKLCNILFAKALNDRFEDFGVRAYVVDPGLVRTDIGNKETGFLVNLIWSLRKRHGMPPTVPAETYAYLCREEPAPEGLYYYLCKEKAYSRQVTGDNARRLFELSERLCGIRFGQERQLHSSGEWDQSV